VSGAADGSGVGSGVGVGVDFFSVDETTSAETIVSVESKVSPGFKVKPSVGNILTSSPLY